MIASLPNLLADASSSFTVLGPEPGLALAIPTLIIGLVFVMAEVFLPSGGVLTILSVFATGASVVFAFMEGTTVGFGFLVCVLMLIPLVLGLSFRFFPHTPIGKLMIVNEDPGTPEGRAAVAKEEKALIGQIGVTRSTLRPSGSADIAGDIRDVITQGEMIDAGARVQVMEVEGNRIVVRAIEG